MLLRLCDLSELPCDGARGFTVAQRSLLTVRDQEGIHVFLNRCPHLGVPLQWETDRFLDSEGAFIRCATHGALFEKNTGLCILGPCRGESLWQVTCQLDGSVVYIDADELPSEPAGPL